MPTRLQFILTCQPNFEKSSTVPKAPSSSLEGLPETQVAIPDLKETGEVGTRDISHKDKDTNNSGMQRVSKARRLQNGRVLQTERADLWVLGWGLSHGRNPEIPQTKPTNPYPDMVRCLTPSTHGCPSCTQSIWSATCTWTAYTSSSVSHTLKC